MVWDTFRTEETASILGDQDIILDADAAEVLVGLQHLVV